MAAAKIAWMMKFTIEGYKKSSDLYTQIQSLMDAQKKAVLSLPAFQTGKRNISLRILTFPSFCSIVSNLFVLHKYFLGHWRTFIPREHCWKKIMCLQHNKRLQSCRPVWTKRESWKTIRKAKRSMKSGYVQVYILNNFFLFSTEIWAEQLKKHSVYRNYDLTGCWSPRPTARRDCAGPRRGRTGGSSSRASRSPG